MEPARHPQPKLADLVLCAEYPRENRWKSNDELIDRRSLLKLSNESLRSYGFMNLRRVKIIEAEREFVLGVLRALSATDLVTSTLLELEINELAIDRAVQLRKGTSVTYVFASLKFLSIDQIHNGPERPRNFTWIVFDTPKLRTVFLGK